MATCPCFHEAEPWQNPLAPPQVETYGMDIPPATPLVEEGRGLGEREGEPPGEPQSYIEKD